MMTNDDRAVAETARLRIEVEPQEYWRLRALSTARGTAGDVAPVLEYLAMAICDGLERTGSWEAECFRLLWGEWPFGDRVRGRSATKTIEVDVSGTQYNRLIELGRMLGAGEDGAAKVLEHVAAAVCAAMDNGHECARMLFGEWPSVAVISCPSCHADVFDESDLIGAPEGRSVCPNCNDHDGMPS